MGAAGVIDGLRTTFKADSSLTPVITIDHVLTGERRSKTFFCSDAEAQGV